MLRGIMKVPHALRLVITLFLLFHVAVFELAAQQTETDQKRFEETKAKAEAGDAESEVQLGFRYYNGEGVAKDEAEAVKWFRRAAEQGLAKSRRLSRQMLLSRRGRDPSR